MTFYHQQMLRIREEVYPKDYLIKQVIHAKLFMDRHYAEKIALKDMAGKAFFSKFHFIRVYKTVYGNTPYQHLKMVRMAKAKELLQTGIPVNEVCFSVGFDSTSSFTGFFKKITGSTPSSFQKNKKKAIFQKIPWR